MTNQDVRMIRKLVGWNLGQLALMVGCSFGHLAKIERGEKRMTPSMERKLADALSITPKQLELLVQFERVRAEGEATK